MIMLFVGWAVSSALAAIALIRFHRIYACLAVAGGPSRGDRAGERWRGMLKDIFLHKRLRRFTLSGVLHSLIFFGFLVLITAALQSMLAALFPASQGMVERISLGWFGALQELAGFAVLVGVILAVWHRYVVRPARFKGSSSRDALVIYLFITAIVAAMFVEFSATRALSDAGHSVLHPISSLLAAGLFASGGDSTATVLDLARWIHVFAILGFVAYVPGSKHRHFLLAGPNIYFRSLKPKGYLPSPQLHVHKPSDKEPLALSWKDQLDVLSCTECGRCQSVCPAASSGAALSPKLVITTLRDQFQRGDGLRFEAGISPEALWSCTTCRACMEECPVHIEHLPKIIDLRRMLVEEAEVEPGLATAFTNLQKTGNSFGKPGKSRARWTKDLPQPVPDARKQPVDWLWFVGDVASFDPRAQETTRRLAELFQRAKMDFGILYDAERNSGNDVRRAGEEGTFRELASSNIDVLSQADFRRIVTTDPHSLNALRNEYPELGASYEVHHHASVLLNLVNEGRLGPVKKAGRLRVTYHDPCYLGRYNDDFDAPRELIMAAGYELIEMPRNRENSFCCGAGGGRIWMDDSALAERPSENRIKEAMALGDIERFVVSCPKDKVMYTAAVENLGLAGKLRVVDVVDLVYEMQTDDQVRPEQPSSR